MNIEYADVISSELIDNYFSSLVNCFFKLLPIRESEEKTLAVYAESLQSELLGAGSIIQGIKNDSGYMSLIAILQHIIDDPEYPVPKVKREVFKAISICNRLKNQYGVRGGE